MTNFNYQRPLDKVSYNGAAVSFMVLAALVAASQANAITEPQKIYSIPNSSSASTHDYFSTESKAYSDLLIRMNEIESFNDNWNDFGASKFSAELITKAKEFLSNIVAIAPVISIFPTASDSIQIEWEKENKYAEVEIFLDNIKVYAERDDKEIVNNSFESLSSAASEFLGIYKS
jgi:hypothetical protein